VASKARRERAAEILGIIKRENFLIVGRRGRGGFTTKALP